MMDGIIEVCSNVCMYMPGIHTWYGVHIYTMCLWHINKKSFIHMNINVHVQVYCSLGILIKKEYGSWKVQDANDVIETIQRDDIITDQDDADANITVSYNH